MPLSKPYDFEASEEEGKFGEGKLSWWEKKVYYPVYRFFRWHRIFHPTEIYSAIKWFIQRGRRGWADCDTWGLDDYLNSWMPNAIEHLKKHTHGYPMSMCNKEEAKLMSSPATAASKNADEAAAARWDAILDKIAEGFRANDRAMDGLYESELGPYSLYRPKDMSREDYKKQQHALFKRRQKLTKRDMALFADAMKLFAKYYNNLWD